MIRGQVGNPWPFTVLPSCHWHAKVHPTANNI